jgi:hypothetical protein
VSSELPSIAERLAMLGDPVVGDDHDADVENFRLSLARMRTSADEQERISQLAREVKVEPELSRPSAPRSGRESDAYAEPEPGHRRRNPIREFLLWCAGTNKAALKLSPTEHPNLLGLGGSVLATAIAATASAVVAMTFVLHSLALSVPISLFWGVLIFNLDRWLVATAGGTPGWARLLNFAPRLLLTVVISVLISEPLLLAIFRPEVDSQLALNNILRASSTTAQIATSYSKEVAAIDTQQSVLQTEIDHRQSQVSSLAAQIQRELDGANATPSSGVGIQYQTLLAQLKQAESALGATVSRNQADMASLNQQRMALQAVSTQEITNARSTIMNDKGLLAHIETLNLLSSERSGISSTIWIVRLMILLVDSMPVLVRLLQSVIGRRSYDHILAAFQYREEIVAERLRAQALTELEITRDAAEHRLQAEKEMADLDLRLLRAEAEHRLGKELARTPIEEPESAPERANGINWGCE